MKYELIQTAANHMRLQVALNGSISEKEREEIIDKLDYDERVKMQAKEYFKRTPKIS